MTKPLDRVDRRILDELQADARISNQDLAKRVGLSGAPCWRRLRRLEKEGFIAGYAGVCFAFATQQLNNTDITFDPTTSFVIISMVVIGGLGSIPGAILGALFLEGLPAIFGGNQTIQFITSGLGLLAFILYLPGGMGELLHRFGDLVTVAVRGVLQRGATPSTPVALAAEGAEP